MHSHDYRDPESYRGRRVLVVGAGPSGMDIGLDVAAVSRVLFHSHHSPVNFRTKFPPHYVRKPDVKEINETGAVFVDESFEEFDDILYCTGKRLSRFHYLSIFFKTGHVLNFIQQAAISYLTCLYNTIQYNNSS